MQTFNEMLEEHFRSNFGKLAKRYRRALGSDHLAEDVVQEAYARCLKYQNSWDSRLAFKPWFETILRNAFRDQINAERGIVFEDLDEYDFESEDNSRLKDLQEQLRVWIARERLADQQLLTLFFFEGYTGKEISHVTEYTQTKIRQTIHKFKKSFIARHSK